MTQAPAIDDLDGQTTEAGDAKKETPAVEVRDAELPEAADAGTASSGGQIDILLDAAVEIAAMLGSARMPVRDILELGPGSVVRLDRLAGDPIDLYLNGVRFATGSLVVVGEHLGVRIREVLKPEGDESLVGGA